MSLGEELVTVLSANVALAAMVSTRVYPSRMPDECAKPAVVYTVVSDVPAASLNGALVDATGAARVQVDSYARTYREAHAVAEAVRGAIGDLRTPSPGLSSWLENARDLFDNETQLHRVTQDFTVWR